MSDPADFRILAIDVGGTGIKAGLLDADGNLLGDRLRVKTPHPCPPEVLVGAILQAVAPIQGYQRISVGFPGVVEYGKIKTAPKLGTEVLAGFDLAGALSAKLGAPAQVINDADMQGLGTVKGKGLEMVITLGTGFGSALFMDGKLAPHLELSMHPLRKGETYNEQLGDATLEEIGPEKWNRRVVRTIGVLRTLTNFDRLYIGGGNAQKIKFPLPPDCEIVSNNNGLRGGAWLWRQPKTTPPEGENAPLM